MSLLEAWIHTPGAKALVWTLVHSLWEGAVVAVLLAALLGTLRGSRSRYAAACSAMLALLVCFGLTFATLLVRELNLAAPAARSGAIPLAAADPGSGTHRPAGEEDTGIAAWLPWLAPVWIAGVLVFHTRSLAGWVRVRRVRRTGVCRAPEMWQQRLDRLAVRMRISGPVQLWESCLAGVPLVIGFLRPAILVPVGMLAGLPAAQVEALLLHELAHVRRYDYLVNLLQVFVEGLLFYHPAVWWTAAVIRTERENCCDDVVVATQGDAYQYCSALAALEQTRGDAYQAVLAANGGSLVKRIRRLLAQPETTRSGLAPVLSAAILTITAVAVLAAWQVKPPASAVEAVPAAVQVARVQAHEAPAAAPKESPYTKWLKEDVVYIIKPEERAAFQRLQTDEERTFFIEQFWQRRNPEPGSPENRFKQEHYRRIAYANKRFGSQMPGWKSDRGRVYIVYGPPDEIESHPGASAVSPFPFEQWRYRYIESVGKDIVIEFVDKTSTGDYRMTTDPAERKPQP